MRKPLRVSLRILAGLEDPFFRAEEYLGYTSEFLIQMVEEPFPTYRERVSKRVRELACDHIEQCFRKLNVHGVDL